MKVLQRIRAEDIPLKSRVIAFISILVSYFFYAYNWDTVDFLRPYFREQYGLSLNQVGLFYTAQSLGAIVGAAITGQIADRKGRKNTLISITLGYAVIILLSIFLTSFPALLLSRFCLGFCLGGVFGCAASIYIGLFQERIRGLLASIVGTLFTAAGAFQGYVGVFLLSKSWHSILWLGGSVPILAAIFMYFAIPDDRNIVPYGEKDDQKEVVEKHVSLKDMFHPTFRNITILLILLSGFNFFGYQAFSGWVTTYLKEERQFSGATMGIIVGAQNVGAIVGTYFWGFMSDRFGRKINIIGLLMGSVVIVIYLFLPSISLYLQIAAFIYGAAISCTMIWGPYFSELYPSHLRTMAASIFHWGHIISFASPSIIAFIAEGFGLRTGMLTASLLYFVTACIWFYLPETLSTKKSKVKQEIVQLDK